MKPALLGLDTEGGSHFRDLGGGSKGPGRGWLVARYLPCPPPRAVGTHRV